LPEQPTEEEMEAPALRRHDEQKARGLAENQRRRNRDPEGFNAKKRAQYKRWKEMNPEAYEAKKAAAREKHTADPEAAKAKHKAWSEANPENIKASQTNYLDKPETKATHASSELKENRSKLRKIRKDKARENHDFY
jgi:hypothetical protein